MAMHTQDTPARDGSALTGCLRVQFFCLGGNFSLFPSATAKNFGTTHAGPNCKPSHTLSAWARDP